MSKKNSRFSNRAARRFNEINKVDTMSQKEIFEILENDIDVILEQVAAFNGHKPNSPYPQYVANAFANLSTVLFFKLYVKDHVKVTKKGKLKSDLEAEQIEALRTILADAYKKSATGFYSNQAKEFQDRNVMLSKTFIMLCPEVYLGTKKFKGLSKSQRRDMTVQIYGDPIYNMKQIHRLVNESTLSDKKKVKLLQKLYGKKRFVNAVGAAMTVESNISDCLGLLFNYMMSLKKRKRAKYIRAYADAYKKAKTRYFRIDQIFFDDNKLIIKELKKIDIGYKKAFRDLETIPGSKKKNKDKYDKESKGFSSNKKK